MLIHLRSLALVGALIVVAVAILGAFSSSASAQEAWVIKSFDVRYVIAEDGTFRVEEDILVDFGSLRRHGIFRDIPVELVYDADYNRLMAISDVRVEDGVQYKTFRDGANLRIRIGDPDVFVTGEQRYRISYTVLDGMNAFVDHDELFWNVTGNDWPAVIESVTATVEVPGVGVTTVACFEGPFRSNAPCASSHTVATASFMLNAESLAPGSGLTLVVGIEPDVVEVGPPVLVDAHRDEFEQAMDFLGPDTVTIPIAVLILIAALAVLSWLWWNVGRDRWFGDKYYFTDDPPLKETKPLFSNETVVVEFEPPPVGPSGRRLRPGEVGLLLDEKADTVDVSATIVDLAVRKYLRIEELEGGKDEYELVRLETPDGELLPYEQRLLDALFRDGGRAQLDDLKNEFYEDLVKVKTDLYSQGVDTNKFFAQDPEKVRGRYSLVGIGVAVAGGLLTWFLGAQYETGLIGVPLVFSGVVLMLTSGAMPRRTARGRQAYRRCLGFRTFITAGDQGRERFAEEAHIFEEYLPYAIVFGSAKKWAGHFEALGIQPQMSGWYVGRTPFLP
ncbi:MAG: DUF2207 domain-containing protein, partial [Chloroflexi bacterium]|nr:DUF2207 domain-containing protein [Chloroflexota bacterium]